MCARVQIVPASLANLGNPINIGLWAIINSCFSIGGLIGSYGVVVPLALLGRKKTLLLTNAFVFASCARRRGPSARPRPFGTCVTR